MIFSRIFENVQLVIEIDEDLYLKEELVFRALLLSFVNEPPKDFLPTKTIHIYSSFLVCKGSFVCAEDDFYCICDTGKADWISTLMDFLEFCYTSILDCTVLHGSCIRHNDKNILILGERKSGKTTLTNYFIDNNAIYLDDDAVFLYHQSLIGFNTPIRMRKNTDNLMLLAKIDDADNEVRYIYSMERHNIINYITKPDVVIFVKYKRNVTLTATRINGFYLINRIIFNVKDNSSLMGIYHDISNYFIDFPAYHIQYSSCHDVMKIISKL